MWRTWPVFFLGQQLLIQQEDVGRESYRKGFFREVTKSSVLVIMDRIFKTTKLFTGKLFFTKISSLNTKSWLFVHIMDPIHVMLTVDLLQNLHGPRKLTVIHLSDLQRTMSLQSMFFFRQCATICCWKQTVRIRWGVLARSKIVTKSPNKVKRCSVSSRRTESNLLAHGAWWREVPKGALSFPVYTCFF